MNKMIPLLCLLSLTSLMAQHSISGTFSPAGNYSWIIAYELQPGGENFSAETRITNGRFKLELPSGSPEGMYRLVYAIPQDANYIDVLYNGKEDIELLYSKEKGPSFISSAENMIFDSYFKDLNAAEQDLIGFYASGKSDQAEFDLLTDRLWQVQSTCEEDSEGLLVHHFIVANTPYIPSSYEPMDAYIGNKRAHYFTKLNFSDPILQASGFLTDKVMNYILTASPADRGTGTVRTADMEENIREAAGHIPTQDEAFQFRLYYGLWKQLSESGESKAADVIYENYLEGLAQNKGDRELLEKIAETNRLRLGARAPEIMWHNDGQLKKLSDLKGAKNYILIFWSSGCSHCLNQLPKLHNALKNKADIKVLAVGLEDDKESWDRESAKLPLFEHVVSMGKWESEYAKLYAIQRTPTYFVLDKDKNIVDKPGDYKELLQYLNEHPQ